MTRARAFICVTNAVPPYAITQGVGAAYACSPTGYDGRNRPHHQQPGGLCGPNARDRIARARRSIPRLSAHARCMSPLPLPCCVHRSPVTSCACREGGGRISTEDIPSPLLARDLSFRSASAWLNLANPVAPLYIKYNLQDPTMTDIVIQSSYFESDAELTRSVLYTYTQGDPCMH
eukprot:363900-Chlamydomonas_euryale.AAC.2